MNQPNIAQREFWSGDVGRHWVDLDAALDSVHREFNAPLLDAADLSPGMSVLDVGCGTGSLSRDAALRLGAKGRVTGVDISPVMLHGANAWSSPTADDAAEIEYLEADAQIADFEPGSFDRIISRLGVMFFANPPAAFDNLRKATKPGGSLFAVAWSGNVKDNLWLCKPKEIAHQVLSMPKGGDPFAPGPLAMADPDYGISLLAQGGWEDVEARPMPVTLRPPGGMAGALSLLTQVGPGAAAIRRGEATAVEIATYRNEIARWLSQVMNGRDLALPVVMHLYRGVNRG